MSRNNELRLMVKIARMYYILGMRQQDITGQLKIHQSSVSRLLKKAREQKIVRMSVDVPDGIFADMEESLERKFGLREAIVVDCPDEEHHMVVSLGAAAAFYIQSTLHTGERIGISSWSRHLLSMVDQLHPTDRATGGKVVQILGGVGNPEIQAKATHLTQRLAHFIDAQPILLPAPGVTSSPKTRDLLMKEPFVREAFDSFDSLDMALVGIGAMQPSAFLANSGNVFTSSELASLKKAGAVGDICMRFYNKEGELVKSNLHQRVIGIDLSFLRRIHRVVGIGGGERKFAAILGALRGRLINVLITDRKTAVHLLK